MSLGLIDGASVLVSRFLRSLAHIHLIQARQIGLRHDRVVGRGTPSAVAVS